MKILIGCEESQEVCKAFRELGFEAYSNDIVDCSGDCPEWHLKMDVFEAIKLQNWDLIIAHPPCNFLSSAAGHLWKNQDRINKMNKAMDFVIKIYNSDCKYIAIENPVGWLNRNWKKPSQIIEPYHFGDVFKKRTCLWLKNLPLLEKTNIVEPLYYHVNSSFAYKGKYSIKFAKNDKVSRAKTFTGIAKAMAEQWGNFLIQNNKS